MTIAFIIAIIVTILLLVAVFRMCNLINTLKEDIETYKALAENAQVLYEAYKAESEELKRKIK